MNSFQPERSPVPHWNLPERSIYGLEPKEFLAIATAESAQNALLLENIINKISPKVTDAFVRGVSEGMLLGLDEASKVLGENWDTLLAPRIKSLTGECESVALFMESESVDEREFPELFLDLAAQEGVEVLVGADKQYLDDLELVAGRTHDPADGPLIDKLEGMQVGAGFIHGCTRRCLAEQAQWN